MHERFIPDAAPITSRLNIPVLVNPEIDNPDIVLAMQGFSAGFESKLVVANANLPIERGKITAIIGPSGCGKSTLIRGFCRMNEEKKSPSWSKGSVWYRGKDIYGEKIDPVEVRRRIGFVPQETQLLWGNIYNNVAYGPSILGITKKSDLDFLVETSLKEANLWDVAGNRLKDSPASLSGGEQQRLSIARALALEPEVLLMDEPSKSLDPIAVAEFEQLLRQLRVNGRTVVIVTHNMEQAVRISDYTAFLNIRVHQNDGEFRWGELVEFDTSYNIFNEPKHKETEEYVSGKIG